MTNSSSCPEPSMVAIPPEPAPVNARALSTTSPRTVLTSRLSLLRRLASLSFERRSRSARLSCLSSSISLNSTPGRDCGQRSVPPRQSPAGRGDRIRRVPGPDGIDCASFGENLAICQQCSSKGLTTVKRAVFFLTAIDGDMIHSFVRQQNRTVSVGVLAPKRGPGEASRQTLVF